jgi:hypothetical protein
MGPGAATNMVLGVTRERPAVGGAQNWAGGWRRAGDWAGGGSAGVIGEWWDVEAADTCEVGPQVGICRELARRGFDRGDRTDQKRVLVWTHSIQALSSNWER